MHRWRTLDRILKWHNESKYNSGWKNFFHRTAVKLEIHCSVIENPLLCFVLWFRLKYEKKEGQIHNSTCELTRTIVIGHTTDPVSSHIRTWRATRTIVIQKTGKAPLFVHGNAIQKYHSECRFRSGSSRMARQLRQEIVNTVTEATSRKASGHIHK